MGGGILPTTIHNGKLYFLFGKENEKYADTPGFSDFGGGTDNNETFLETAIREAGEELTGFLGDDTSVRKLLSSHGTYNIDYNSNGHKTYRMHIFPFVYNPWLSYYYNNNQRFLQKNLPTNVFKTTRIFEKAEIRWICVDELKHMRPKFRSYFRDIIDMILEQKDDIKFFIKKGLKKGTEKKTLRRSFGRHNKTKRHMI